MKTPGIIRAAQFGIVALSLGSYSLSFERLYLASLSSGTPWQLAIVYGLLLEGYVTLATFTAWVARGTRKARMPWAVAIGIFSFSFVANYDSSIIQSGFIRSLPVVLVPIGVHLLIVLTTAYKAREAAAEAPTVVEVPVEVEKIVEVAADIAPETLDVTKVQNPRAVAYRLLAETSDREQQRGYYRKQYNEALVSAA